MYMPMIGSKLQNNLNSERIDQESQWTKYIACLFSKCILRTRKLWILIKVKITNDHLQYEYKLRFDIDKKDETYGYTKHAVFPLR